MPMGHLSRAMRTARRSGSSLLRPRTIASSMLSPLGVIGAASSSSPSSSSSLASPFRFALRSSFPSVHARSFATGPDGKAAAADGADSTAAEGASEDEAIKSAEKEPLSKEKVPEATEKAVGATKKHTFQAETQELLHIVSRAIYTDKEVFLRELISNASDACEQARFLSTSGQLEDGKRPLEIRIYTDPDKNTITIQDHGIGMSEKQLISNIGTIARSGSKRFLKELKDSASKKSGSSSAAGTDDRTSAIIGQFGVGFYSSFMVSDNVEVFSKSGQKGEPAKYWKSGPEGSYEVGDAEGVKRGTKVVLHLNDDCKEFSDKVVVERIIKRYSDFILFPVFLNDKKVNVFGALWAQPAKEISEEKYAEFYKHLTNAYDKPMDRLHFTSDVPIAIQALFYIPSMHTEKYGMARMEPGVSVYSRKVLIKPKAKEILPDWLRFVKGVVDSEDLPLHISREQLQDSRLIKRISKSLVKKLVSHFDSLSKRDKKKFETFYKEYSVFLKEGVCTDYDNKERIGKLLHFESSKGKSGELRSLDDYIATMKTEQKKIYYLVAPNRKIAEASPYFEAFKARGTEVLFMYTPIDEIVMQNLGNYMTRSIVSIEGKDVSADDTEQMDWAKDEKAKHVLKKEQADELCEWMEKKLSEKLKSVKTTTRLSDSPAIIVDHESSSVRDFMKLVNQDNPNGNVQKHKLEVNPNHPIVRGLFYTMNDDEHLAAQVSEQLLDHALIAANLLDDPRSMLNRMNQLLTVAMDVEGIEQDMVQKEKDAAPKAKTKVDAKATTGKVEDAKVEEAPKQTSASA